MGRLWHLVAVAALALSQGCATIINGTDQEVTVRTDPPGAVATVDGGRLSKTTPCAFDLSRGDAHQIEVAMPGYKTHRVLLESKFGGAIFGNLLLGGLIGAVVDSASNASRYLEPDEIHIVMERGSGLAEWPPPSATPPPTPPPPAPSASASARVPADPEPASGSGSPNRQRTGRFTRY